MKKINYTFSISKLANSINPEWKLDDWLQWPPDMYALCSTVLNRTGIYKSTLMNTQWWENKEWDHQVSYLSEQWVKRTSNRLLGKADNSKFNSSTEIIEWVNTIQNEWDTSNPIDLDRLRVLGKVYVSKTNSTSESERIRIFTETLIKFYILADASCSGLGFLGQSLSNTDSEHRIFMASANLLLNSTGSLSTISKTHGTVVPKMRSPRSGMIGRSLGFHLTFHVTEVEVIWRTFPRLENTKRKLNVLAVPYPSKIKDDDFVVCDDHRHVVKYFKGNIDRNIDQPFLSGLVFEICDMGQKGDPVDIVVFPEMSLSYAQYQFLLIEFEAIFNLQRERIGNLQPPMLVVGIIKSNAKDTGYIGVDKTFQNEVRMAVFFSGRWYSTTQRKHHRWQLNRSQIENYDLNSVLDPKEKWFEFCSISQRRLTVLAPNAWLALTALICEDLARQEPVSEIIRGIGPTLLMALLCDGPQIQKRWSGRYATVLAEDPGTAVLSLTSSGMMKRSKPPKNVDAQPVIGLWKDLYSDPEELKMQDTHHAVLLSMSAEYEEEFTLDGRSDGASASVFELRNKTPIIIKKANTKETNKEDLEEAKTEDRIGNIRELSALQFSIDAIIDILDCKTLSADNFKRAIDLILHLIGGAVNPPSSNYYFRERIINKVKIASKDPSLVGISASSSEFSNVNMVQAAEVLQKIIKVYSFDVNRNTTDLYQFLIGQCIEILTKDKSDAAIKLAPMSMLYNLYNRVSDWDPNDKDSSYIDGMSALLAISMKETILKFVNDN